MSHCQNLSCFNLYSLEILTSLGHDHSSMPFYIQEIRQCTVVLIFEYPDTTFLPALVKASKNLVIFMDYLKPLHAPTCPVITGPWQPFFPEAPEVVTVMSLGSG